MSFHSHEVGNLNSKLKLGILLNTAFTIIQFAIGFISGSLAIISDAGHNLTDSLSLVISFFAQKISDRKSTPDKTFGYGRATIISALINSVILIALAIYIFYEAYTRFQHPQEVSGSLIALVSFIGILVNGGIALMFRNSTKDLNMRSAFLSMAFDTLASVGALVAGIIIYFTHFFIIDVIVSIIIGLMLLLSAWGVLKDALHILFEGTPRGLDFEKIKKDIFDAFPEITNVDDLHIWSISSNKTALSCHITIENSDINKSVEIVKEVKKILHDRFEIEHSTIEIELDPCNDGFC
ncbi:MAG: cation diffusion facilitator family transporter [Saprospiraceae bacterium]|jgi:cobalt-zinc-cadmium efflux system protein